MSKIHDLDQNVEESFIFRVRGYEYIFKQPNTEELEEIQDLGDDEKKLKKFLFNFITPRDSKTPSFKDISKKMIAPQWLAFRDMIKSELGG